MPIYNSDGKRILPKSDSKKVLEKVVSNLSPEAADAVISDAAAPQGPATFRDAIAPEVRPMSFDSTPVDPVWSAEDPDQRTSLNKVPLPTQEIIAEPDASAFAEPVVADPALGAPPNGPRTMAEAVFSGGPAGYKVEEIDPQLLRDRAAASKEAGAMLKATGETIRNEQQQLREFTKQAQIDAVESLEWAHHQSALAAQAAETTEKAVRGASDELMARRAEAERVASTAIDPSRFWANKDGFQKASAVIAGALFGFSGKGMEWLNHLESLVSRDIEAQKSDRATRLSALDKSADSLQAKIQLERQLGGDREHQILMQKDDYMTKHRLQLESIARASSNAQHAQQAAMMAAQIGERQVQLHDQLVNSARQGAEATNSNRYRNASLAQQHAEARMRYEAARAKASQPAETTPLPATESKAFNEKLEAINAMRRMSKLASKDGEGVTDRIGRGLRSLVDINNKGAGMDDTEYRQLSITLGRIITGGVINKNDEVQLAKAGIAPGEARGWLKNPGGALESIAARMESDLAGIIQRAEKEGRNVEGLKQQLANTRGTPQVEEEASALGGSAVQ